MKWICGILVCGMLGCVLSAAPINARTYPGPYPQKEISNRALRAKVYLPDAEKGFYRGTRFDWAGVVGSLEYKGHSYYGPFFEKFNPAVEDVTIGDPIEAGVNSAASGPVEEFIGADEAALGYSEAKPGEAFCKIGVGSLRKIDNAAYSSYTKYPILNGGKRTVSSGSDWVEFTQQVDCGSGYGYRYTKKIRLLKDQPAMTIEDRLVNTGEKRIQTLVYDHNFLSIDHQPTGPEVVLTFRFTPKPTEAMDQLASIRENDLVFTKKLTGSDTFYKEFRGFGKAAFDYNLQVENRKTGAGVAIHCDRPLVRVGVWAVRTVVAPEPYIEIDVLPGKDFSWKYTYEFYSSSSSK